MEMPADIRVAICAIARNEENYIDEWIDYHLTLGIDFIHVYGNDWEFTPKSKCVICERLSRSISQVDAYNKFLSEGAKAFDWVFFIDIDEFIHLPNSIQLKKFLNSFKDFSGVIFNWNQIYSCGVEFEEGNYSVLKRFDRNQGRIKFCFKSALNLALDSEQKMLDAHSTNHLEKYIDAFGNPYEMIKTGYVLKGGFSPIQDIPCIDHYFTKTREEFEKRTMDSVGYFFDEETVNGKLHLFE